MFLDKVLTDDEIISNTKVFKRYLKDINTVMDRNMDTSNDNLKHHYSDMVCEFNIEQPIFFTVKKSNYCEIGNYIHQSFYENILEQINKKTNELKIEYEAKIQVKDQRIKRLEMLVSKPSFKIILNGILHKFGILS
jgi:hypothetical protein